MSTVKKNARARRDVRPNIVLIVVDDLRWDEFGAGGHPYLQTPNVDRLAAEGALFTRAMHASPLCSPNRACILTGRYVASHCVYNNEDKSLLSHLLPTFPRELQRAGYRTAHVGKWHMGNDPTPRPGFDYWVSFKGQGKIIDPELYEKGGLRKVPGYITDLLTDRALGFIREQRASRRPYCLYLAHKAVHPDAIQRNDGSLDTAYGMRYIAAERHRGRYRNAIFPRDRLAKSARQGALGSEMVQRFLERKSSPGVIEEFGEILDPGTCEQSIRDRAEMMLSIDEGVGALLSELDESGALENTVIMLTSDNGFFFGEHNLSIERRLPYEEAIRSPLLVRFPPKVAAASTINELVSCIDIAPSILDFAGAGPGSHVQGTSFVPLLTGRKGRVRGRPCVLIENFAQDRPMPWVLDADYKAIRTDRYKLIHWLQHPEFDELYDLKTDPQENRNLIRDRGIRGLADKLRAKLATLVRQSLSL
jgi:arylsulfatase A-like enzyme